MSLDPLTALLDIGKTALDKFVPDPQAKAQAALELEKLHAAGNSEQLQAQVQLMLAQADITKTEAMDSSLFVKGGRPAIIWVCAASLFTYYVPYCLVATAIWGYQCIQTGALAPRPDLGIADLIALTSSMLGLGAMRTIEKMNGKA
jgi:hypothetical protein